MKSNTNFIKETIDQAIKDNNKYLFLVFGDGEFYGMDTSIVNYIEDKRIEIISLDQETISFLDDRHLSSLKLSQDDLKPILDARNITLDCRIKDCGFVLLTETETECITTYLDLYSLVSKKLEKKCFVSRPLRETKGQIKKNLFAYIKGMANEGQIRDYLNKYYPSIMKTNLLFN